jgi:uncharacterized membrane protein YciS (DUF1049 family)
MKEKLVETILPLITVTAVILISVTVGSNIATGTHRQGIIPSKKYAAD